MQTIAKTSLSCAAAVAFLGAATAADLPSRKAPPPSLFTPTPVFSWSGFYFGAQGGYTTERFRQVEYLAGVPTGFQAGWKGDGGVAGIHAGTNYQFSAAVVGLEGDVEGASLRGTVIGPSAAGGLDTAVIRQDVRGSLRGRVGYAFDRLLIYATGGLAVADFRGTLASPFASDTASITRAGYTVGGGLEYMFLPNWSARAEYRYSEYTRVSQTSFFAFPGYAYNTSVRDHSIRAGLSYHYNLFGTAPVVARF